MVGDILVLLPFIIAFILIGWDYFRKRGGESTPTLVKAKTLSNTLWDKLCEGRACPTTGRWIEKVIFGEEDDGNVEFCYRYPTKQINFVDDDDDEELLQPNHDHAFEFEFVSDSVSHPSDELSLPESEVSRSFMRQTLVVDL